MSGKSEVQWEDDALSTSLDTVIGGFPSLKIGTPLSSSVDGPERASTISDMEMRDNLLVDFDLILADETTNSSPPSFPTSEDYDSILDDTFFANSEDDLEHSQLVSDNLTEHVNFELISLPLFGSMNFSILTTVSAC